MFERFTDGARRAIVRAQDEARSLRHSAIGTEHILLAVVHEGEGPAADALESLGIPPEDVRAKVLELLAPGEEAPRGDIPFTGRAKKALELTLREALQLGNNYIGTEHLLLGLLREGEGVAAQALVTFGVDLDIVRQEVVRLHKFSVLDTKETEESFPRDEIADADRHEDKAVVSAVLDQFGDNLTQLARSNALDPVIGRGRELAEVMQVLSRRNRNNPVLIGEPGIGKAVIVEGLAQALVRGDVPASITGMEVYKLNFDKLTSTGMGLEGNLESVIAEVELRKDIILFIDEMHPVLGKNSIVSTMEIITKMVPTLVKGSLKIVGATTMDDYKREIERNVALHQILAQVTVDELSIPAATQYLKPMRDRLEAYYRLTITDEALSAASLLARHYLRNQVLPESAVALLDEAGARLSVSRMSPPSDIKALDERIAAVKMAKELAIDGQDLKLAASLRDQEQNLIVERSDKEREWKTSDSPHDLSVIDETAVVEVVAIESGVPVTQILNTLHPRRKLTATSQLVETNSYVLLGDQPVKDLSDDFLGAAASAEAIAAIISDSRDSSPFVMAVDGGWGMGKSTLLHQVSSCLSKEEGMHIVHFNAWTSQGERALEGLIKSVLSSLDRNSLRRGFNTVIAQRNTLLIARICLGALARFVGAARLVDEIWNRLEIDAQGRNELRSAIFGMLSSWTSKGEASAAGKFLIIVIDDLDRCSDQVIVQICEAVKLYLDAPGLIFLIGCDYTVLKRGVSTSDRGSEARIYLEKIIQVVHRLQPCNEDQLRGLVRGYAQRSGTAAVVDETIEDILCQRAGRNPRRIKRIINSFVLESRLNPAWNSPELGNDQLIKAVIIHHLYPSFYDELINEKSGRDPIGDFLDYAEVKGRSADPPPPNDPWWSTNSKLFRRHDMAPPSRSILEREELSLALTSLEANLPSEYPLLARDVAFISLLRGVGDDQARAALRSLLMNEPLQSATFAEVVNGDKEIVGSAASS